jgi:para-aminobenzoate synthetase component 1
LAARPKATIIARDDQIVFKEAGRQEIRNGNPWKELQLFRDRHNDWLCGYLGYDLKNHIEILSSGNQDLVEAPDLFFMVPDLLIEFDHQTGKTNIIRGEMPEKYTQNGTDSFFELRDLQSKINEEEYKKKIIEAQRRITEGDFYEINLSHQMQGHFRGSAFALYQRMKEVGPVPFGAFLQMDKLSVCCQSPERFLRKEGNRVFSQPIKGTSQRGRNTDEDKRLKQELTASQKEQAENLMIVDLVRNDLSKIAETGSVKVPKLFEIQSFDTVHQMVSTVEAEAAEENPVEILKACFPMGSMTGAPKISTMKTIEELEDYRRGMYSGAVGYITPDGNFDFNVVIRTAIIKQDHLFYSIGGAITSDSDAKKEWEETLIKAQALLKALGKNNQPDLQLQSQYQRLMEMNVWLTDHLL